MKYWMRLLTILQFLTADHGQELELGPDEIRDYRLAPFDEARELLSRRSRVAAAAAPDFASTTDDDARAKAEERARSDADVGRLALLCERGVEWESDAVAVLGLFAGMLHAARSSHILL
ncbi:hypothetical protein AXG93_4022s1240 [Marchantia polymorpha subsp. ruderalis]|uniref:Uncharacterized protein n=1 Tax=Marchantia polymorpha subsp. ruderalis TaxID=1480154 RepID=A0A176W0Q7_MARPO|nr:hypothetical protein AXG93_4022s1240 [Marchantia polymorpha subsp. ruderalis]